MISSCFVFLGKEKRRSMNGSCRSVFHRTEECIIYSYLIIVFYCLLRTWSSSFSILTKTTVLLAVKSRSSLLAGNFIRTFIVVITGWKLKHQVCTRKRNISKKNENNRKTNTQKDRSLLITVKSFVYGSKLWMLFQLFS